jgi:conjugative transfer signal peptidase TraF
MNTHRVWRGPVQSVGKRFAIRAIVSSVVLIGGVASAFALGGYRINTTPSFPLGLWQIEPLRRDAAIGDTVFICPPTEGKAFQLARERGYFPNGLCDGSVAPLIKTVVALPGQAVTVRDLKVYIDGTELGASSIQTKDGHGRPMTTYAGGIVPPGFVFLHSDFVASYDSRYFGPVPAKGILGLANPVLTFAP